MIAPRDQEIIGALLGGGCTLFGKRIELAWPDGLPGGFSEETLLRIADEWKSPGLMPHWVPVAAARCQEASVCGRLLTDDCCAVHGAPSC